MSAAGLAATGTGHAHGDRARTAFDNEISRPRRPAADRPRSSRQPRPAYRPHVSLAHLLAARAACDKETLIRYVRLHFGDGNEHAGRLEIDKAWVQALDVLLDMPEIDREFVHDTLTTKDAATLAHLFFSLHYALVRSTGEWIHDGDL